jgi:hypothetical protein
MERHARDRKMGKKGKRAKQGEGLAVTCQLAGVGRREVPERESAKGGTIYLRRLRSFL